MTIHDLFQRGLNLQQLRSFLEVAQNESVTKAAGGSSSRRSLMSRQIGELERALGFEVFSRNGRSIEINQAGRELALVIAAFFTEFETAVRRGNRMESVLKIGAGAAVLEALLLPRLLVLQKEFRNVQIDFRPYSTQGVLGALASGKIDLGIVRTGLQPAGISEIPTGSLDYALVGRRDFDTQLPSWNARIFLRRVPLAILNGEGYWVQCFNRLCGELEIEPRVTVKAETFGHLRDLIKAGAPGTVLPTPLTKELPPSEFVVLEDQILAPLSRNLGVFFDERASKVRHRLSSYATMLAGAIAHL